jgi:hypothetical protein
MDPIKTLPKPSKSIHWMYQANWDDSEAMIRPSCWLDIWILSQKLGWLSWIFYMPHKPNQPVTNHGSNKNSS